MFRRTVISLALQYSVLLLFVFAVFSVGVYAYTRHSFDQDGTNNANNYDSTNQLQASHDLTDENIHNLRTNLALAYGSLIVVVPIVSYGLARRALHPIIEGYRAQQQFVDNASHELRTPLSVIQGELELAVSRPRTNDAYRVAIHTSLDEVTTLVQLVEHLLLLARGDNQQLHDYFVPVNVNELINSAVNAVKAAHSNRTPAIRTSITKQLEAYGVPGLMKQALVNVLDNAAKFTEPTGQVNITSTANDHAVIIKIQDTGVGIGQGDLPRAFDRFWRAETARSIKGYGLGLTLTQQIMKIHRGSIELASFPGKGTTVTLTFPSKR